MPVTTRNVFKLQVQEHILNNLSTDSTQDVKEQLQHVVDAFGNWYTPYEKKRNPNRWAALRDWLLCLPSEWHVEYTYSGIHETLKKWFEGAGETYKEHTETKEADYYYSFVIREFLVLCRKHGVNAYN